MKEPFSQKEILLITLLSLSLASLLQVFFPWKELWGDELDYIHQSQEPFITRETPWTYRTLTPLLVTLNPLPLAWGFRIMTALGTAVVLSGFYWMARRCVGSIVLSLAALGLYAVHPQPHYLAAHCALVDAITIAALTVASYAVLFRHHRLLSTALLLGILNHEAVLLFFPVPFLAVCWESDRIKNAVRTAILCLPALVVFIFTRFILPSFDDARLVERVLSDSFPTISPHTRYLHVYMNEFLHRIEAAGGFVNLLVSGDPAGGATVLFPLAVIGFIRSSRRAKSLAIFPVLLFFIPLVVYAHQRISYLGFAVIGMYVACFLSQLSVYPAWYQVCAGVLPPLGMIFFPASWVCGLLLAALICVPCYYLPERSFIDKPSPNNNKPINRGGEKKTQPENEKNSKKRKRKKR